MLRLILAFLSAIIFLNCASSYAQIDEPSFEFDANEAVKWLPMSKHEAYSIVFPVSINGKKYNALIDTGSTGPILFSITEKVQKEMGLSKVSEQKARAYGGRITSDVVSLPSIKVGGMSLNNQLASVIAGGFFDGSDVDIVIRQTLLHSLLLQVDWQKNRLRFLLTGDSPESKYQTPITFREDSDQVFTPVTLCGSTHDFFLDTGLENASSINPRFVDINNCIGRIRSDIRSSGYGGPLTSVLVTIPKLSLGTSVFNNIISSLENPKGPLNEGNIAGSIGYGLINRANFILDIGAGKLEFYGAVRPQHIPERPTIGIQITESLGIVTVSHIMSNSPAEASILRVGDKICKIDGQTITENEYWTLNPKAGTILSIDLCNDKTIKITAYDFLESHNELDTQNLTKEIDLSRVGEATHSLGLCENWKSADTSLIKYCSNVIDNDAIPNYYKLIALSNRMQLYPYANRHAEAITDINQFIKAQGDTAQLFIFRAASMIELARYDEARMDIENAIKTDTNLITAHILQAYLDYKLKDYSSGIIKANKALAIAPDDEDALNMLALGYYYTGDYAKALDTLDRSFAQDNEYAETYIIRTLIHRKNGKECLADADYKRAHDISTDEAKYAIKRWSEL